MKTLWRTASRLRHTPRTLAAVALGLLLAAPAFAQGTSPWENAVKSFKRLSPAPSRAACHLSRLLWRA